MQINFEPIERVTVSDEIIRQVIALINTGKLRPGSKLPSERELMDRFRVSRSSVREALHALTMIGLLETYPGDGTYVSRQLVDIIGGRLEWSVLLGNSELLELMEVREPLEIQAAGLAAQRATAESIQRLRDAVDAFSASPKSVEDQMDAEFAIHTAIAQLAENSTLCRIIRTFQDVLKEYRVQKHIGWSSSPAIDEEYRGILNAIEDGDAELARHEMSQHLERSKRQALVEQLNEHTGQTGPNTSETEGDSKDLRF